MFQQIVYIVRNPKDTAVSLFHYYKDNPNLPSPETWAAFLELFLKGDGKSNNHHCFIFKLYLFIYLCVFMHLCMCECTHVWECMHCMHIGVQGSQENFKWIRRIRRLSTSPPWLLKAGSFKELGDGLADREPKTSSGLHPVQPDSTELHLDILSCLITWMLGFELRSCYLCCKCLYLLNHLPTMTIIF